MRHVPSFRNSFLLLVMSLIVGETADAATRMGRWVKGDYDGDGRSDVSVYRKLEGTWHFENGQIIAFGPASFWSQAAPGDYDGDGIGDLAVVIDGTYQVRYSSTGESVVHDVDDGSPVPGDYDGDGKTDMATYAGNWHIPLSGSPGTVRRVFWVIGGNSLPVQADYDGDGKTDIAVFNRVPPDAGRWTILLSTTGATRVVQWGGSGGDIPIPFDFDGDGKDDIAIESPVDGRWYIIRSGDGGTTIVQWGGSGGDQPQPGDFDGDGKADIAIFVPASDTSGYWYIVRSSDGATVVAALGQRRDVGIAKGAPIHDPSSRIVYQRHGDDDSK